MCKKGPALRVLCFVQEPRDDLFAGSCVARDQNVNVRLGDRVDSCGVAFCITTLRPCRSSRSAAPDRACILKARFSNISRRLLGSPAARNSLDALAARASR